MRELPPSPERQAIRYGDDIIHYVVRRLAGRHKSVRIHVNPNGFVEVEAPEEADARTVREAVRARAQWIMNNLQEIAERRAHVLPREYVSGESHLYLGRRYMLKVVPLDAKGDDGKARERQGVKLSGSRLIVKVELPRSVCLDKHSNSPATQSLGDLESSTARARGQKVKTLLRSWYREHAQAYFAKRLKILGKDIPWLDTVPNCRLQTMRRQWGSCSPTGTLLLNPHLIKAPARCVDYVLLHEICHLREHNHSGAFYRLLESLLPSWEATKDKLDNMAELLLNE